MSSGFFMVRGISEFFYTLEFLIAAAVFLVVLYFYIKKIDRKLLFVFLIAGSINTGVELLLQGLGIRMIEGAFFFSIPIGFPTVCFILGFMEGGVKALVGYCVVKIIMDHSAFFKRLFFGLFTLVLSAFSIYAIVTVLQFASFPSSVLFTARELFGLLSVSLLLLAFGVSFGSILLNRSIPNREKRSILYFMLGQALYLLAFTFPLHISLLRYIGLESGGTYISADPLSQLLLMYGFFLFFEGIGVNIINYPIIYRLKLIQFDPTPTSSP